MATLSWKVDNIEVKPQEGELTDVVYNVYWRLYAEELGMTISNYGSVIIPLAEEGQFIPFEELDEATVIGWVHSVMGPDTVLTIETLTTAELQAILSPEVVSKPAPWL
jgi:hypothetical protein